MSNTGRGLNVKPGRNDPCPCGSGKKLKKCCHDKFAVHSAFQPLQQSDAAVQMPGQQEIDALALLFNQQRYIEAESLARTMAVRFPLSGFCWKVLGAVFKQTGRSADALVAMQKAATLSPADAQAHFNLGVTLNSCGQLDEAVTSYQRALAIKPDYVEAHFNLGITLNGLRQFDKAAASYRRALEINPNLVDAHNNIGVVLQGLGQLDDAVASCRRALEINPNYAVAYGNLGDILRVQGKLDEALVCYQQLACLEPENDMAKHYVASLTGSNPERAPPQYVENVFDAYADKFDTHLQQVLKYTTPEKLVALVMQHLAPATEKWNVLDLGCGTGLVGLAIAPFARQLVGVDLSAKMLEKAHARSLYQRLERIDLLTMMQGEKNQAYDVIIAADVFIYLGKLDEIVGEIKRLLCPGGVFTFSIEALEALPNEEASQGVQQEYRLENTGRYSHSASYLARLASTNGFLSHEMVASQIRMERGKAVNGYLVLWKS